MNKTAKIIVAVFACLGLFSFGGYANQEAHNATVSAQKQTTEAQTLAKVESLVAFVVSIEKGAPASRADLTYFATQLEGICKAVPGCVPLTPPS